MNTHIPYMVRISLFIASFLISCMMQGQEHYVFSPINSSDGLSEDRVHSITQLADGRMVIITEGLVNLYNGTSFQYLHINDRDVYSLTGYHGYYHTYIDGEGQLWVKDYQRLLLFDIKQERFVAKLDSVLALHGVHLPIVDFFMDSEHNFWFLTQDGKLIYRDTNKENPHTFIEDISLLTADNDKLLDMTVYEHRVFMFFYSGLMICFDLYSHEELFRENPFEGKPVDASGQVMFIVPYKQYLYLVRNGYTGLLLRYDIKRKVWETILEQDYWLNTISLDREGNIGLSCPHGLWFIDKDLRWKRHISELQLVDGRVFKTAINAQYSDNQGGLWIGTPKYGLLYYHPDRFKFRNIGRTLFDVADDRQMQVNCFAERGDEILVGTSAGLFSYSPETARLERFEKIPQKVLCYTLLKDKKQRIWLCANRDGLFCIDGERVSCYTFPPRDVFYLYENTDGSFYLSLGQGIGIFDPETGTCKQLESTHGIGVIYQLAECGQNSLIGLSDAGIFIYDKKNDLLHLTGTYERERPPMFQQNNYRYDCLYSDSRGLIWLGTRDGLSVWDEERALLRNFHTEDGLINNRIQSIIEDHQHAMWISTSGGISRIEMRPGKEGVDYTFSNFNRYDGVIKNELFERSVFCSSTGLLLWGGIDGFNAIDPQRMNDNRHKLPKPLFTKFFLFGTEVKQGERMDGRNVLLQSISASRELHLKYNQNFVTFEFSALNYVNPAQTYYRYQLEGMDESLQEVAAVNGVGRANYTNLPPGSYTLKVYAGANNEWSDEYAQIKLFITPPFWKTPIAYALYLLLFLLLFYLSTSYYLKQKRIKMMRQQQEYVDKLKLRFFTNVSHELRTPLTLILTPLDALLKKRVERGLKDQLMMIYRNAEELLRMVNQLLDFRKLEVTGETLRLSYCCIDEFVDSICSSFEPLMRDKEICFSRTITLSGFYLYVDKDKIRKIISNLLTNAYKFTPKGGSIEVLLDGCKLPDSEEEGFFIRIVDTGRGIPEKELPHIFNRFHQVAQEEGQHVGSGIGLHLVQEYVRLHNGIVQVESKQHEGSAFTVYIPANLQLVNKQDPGLPLSGNEKSEDGLTVLVVEDNDEFRGFLTEQLSGQYTVVAAVDGVEGVEKALSALPDLIISDIMMPRMDGVELCKHLKQDLRTSHIPIILLTARSSDEAQVAGYESGADAYISKPFNLDILYLRIHNLLEQQRKRKELFKKAIVIQPEAVTITTVDEKLVRKAIECIEQNLNDPKFSVEQLSNAMNMDRTGLYRKLVAITGQTPSAFIRSIRLKKAAWHLKQGLTVSEVADMVGFGTISYFSKCFQEEFGVKPSMYKGMGE